METNSIDEKITFVKWWEGKRILFNMIVLIGIISIIFYLAGLSKGNSEINSNDVKVFLAILLFINILYSIFSLIGFIFKSIIGNFENEHLNSFFQNKRFWQFLFILKILMAFSGFLIVIGGASDPAPYNYNLH